MEGLIDLEDFHRQKIKSKVQNPPQKYLLFCPSASRLPKISKMLVEGQYIPIPLPRF